MRAQINSWPDPQGALEGPDSTVCPITHFEAKGKIIVPPASLALVATTKPKREAGGAGK